MRAALCCVLLGAVGAFVPRGHPAVPTAWHGGATTRRGGGTTTARRRGATLRHADALDAASDALRPRRPSPSLKAEDVVAAQMDALQEGDAMRCFKFASPSNKAAAMRRGTEQQRVSLGGRGVATARLGPTPTPQVTGPWQRFRQMIANNPEYSPMLRCSRWEFVGAVALNDARKQLRVRVFPAGGSAAPFAIPPSVEYTFEVSLQPESESERAVSNCWCTDAVIAG